MTESRSGDKYRRVIRGTYEEGLRDDELIVDVYDVLVAFGVTCPATQHAVKKFLCAGLRGKGDRLNDLREAKDAVERAIKLHLNEVESEQEAK